MSSVRLYLLRFAGEAWAPTPPGSPRPRIEPMDPVLAVIDERPGWESQVAMAFGTIPGAMSSTPMMRGASSCMSLRTLVRRTQSSFAGELDFLTRTVRALRARVAALELRVSTLELRASTLERELEAEA